MDFPADPKTGVIVKENVDHELRGQFCWRAPRVALSIDHLEERRLVTLSGGALNLIGMRETLSSSLIAACPAAI